jgi:hypothetical protein
MFVLRTCSIFASLSMSTLRRRLHSSGADLTASVSADSLTSPKGGGLIRSTMSWAVIGPAWPSAIRWRAVVTWHRFAYCGDVAQTNGADDRARAALTHN